MQQINVVISGFDHYDGVAVNPCVDVPRTLAERGVADLPDGIELAVHAVSLPVSYTRAWESLHDTLESVRPDIVIATGLKHTARGVLLERCATNQISNGRPDADGMVPPTGPIRADGPAAYWTRLPLRSILRDFTRDGIPASLSSDAGTFVCNSLFYRLMDWTAKRDHALSGFVSLPRAAEDHAVADGHGLPIDRLVAACGDVIRETMRYRLEPSSGDILIA
ncbi:MULTISPECIES: pyroglutamyl-peptidase I [Bifidobacterium]|uniref:pyroglutamyl-peptidase I n=1 Tax=Bifidobacterium TaxID=1678 RepID=UPI001BDCA5BB|nr:MULTISPECIES: pyroglutamyl-peptidase I [Bifidobacterium]MBT1160573.1 pyroglutamyl-peptidase I [Bifidobacterium sp. SO1]MBW3078545.1 pyroglutamyl-peptidase I [Bifidobacterium simiiventris]